MIYAAMKFQEVREPLMCYSLYKKHNELRNSTDTIKMTNILYSI